MGDDMGLRRAIGVGKWVAMTAVLLTSSAAFSHELSCEKRVNGASIYKVDSYPATLEWTMKVRKHALDGPLGG